MKLKNKILVLLSGVLLTTTSCGDWLDITPQDTTTEKNLFSTFGGYRSSLNGIYQELASSELYGKELTWGFVSALGQYYSNFTVNRDRPYVYTEMYEYKNQEVQEYAKGIWKAGYNAVANCNNLLQHLSTFDKSNFPFQAYGEAELIEGEALAVRALVHFDMLRLFAPSPKADKTKPAIPYSTQYPDKIPALKTVTEVLNMAIADLRRADSLVSIYDIENKKLSYITLDRFIAYGPTDFLQYRGTRMNALAIRALLARVYLYKGEIDEAFSYANDIYTNYKTFFPFTPSNSLNTIQANRPRKLVDDLIVAFHNRRLIEEYNDFYIGLDKVGNTTQVILEAKNVTYMYTIFKNDADDHRYKSLLFKPIANDSYTSLKYTESSNEQMNTQQGPLLPIIRMSEMLYIMAEYYASKNDMKNATAMLKEVRIPRGATSRNSAFTASMSLETFMEELEYEVWKENLGEGQFFFFCKRRNNPTMRNGLQFIDMTNKWVLDIPQGGTSLL